MKAAAVAEDAVAAPPASFEDLARRLNAALDVPGISIPAVGVALVPHGQAPPPAAADHGTPGETVTCCQAVRHAAAGWPVWLTRENIGCVAAAVSLGLVDQWSGVPLEAPRAYTDIMRRQSGRPADFQPPSPRDFTLGRVYACAAAGRPEFGLFGPGDSGRFHDLATARRAVAQMPAIQPAAMQGVYLFPPGASAPEPDVVLLDVRPVEATRLLQGYQFLTGRSVNAHLNPLRALDADLIARPYLTGTLNLSTYCLGARLLGRFGADRLGLGMPLAVFATLVEGLEASATGYPFERYPGAFAG